jgi:phosphopantothenoylcysteine synthetase/decarboxylase
VPITSATQSGKPINSCCPSLQAKKFSKMPKEWKNFLMIIKMKTMMRYIVFFLRI